MTPLKNQKNPYQRFEFIGDRVLNLIVSQYLYRQYPDLSEGDLTNKMRFTSNDNLDEVVDGLTDEFRAELFTFKRHFNPDTEELGADDVEAYIGNYFLEHGAGAAIPHFEQIFAEKIDAFDPDTDYISRLQMYTQQNKKILPEYTLENDEIRNNQHTFCFQVFIDGKSYGYGTGSRHSEAKKQAAAAAIQKLAGEGKPV